MDYRIAVEHEQSRWLVVRSDTEFFYEESNQAYFDRQSVVGVDLGAQLGYALH